jgi:hypothetical protein
MKSKLTVFLQLQDENYKSAENKTLLLDGGPHKDHQRTVRRQGSRKAFELMPFLREIGGDAPLVRQIKRNLL